METRNILDNLGNIVGTLTLPSGTTEQQWQLALAPYAALSVSLEKLPLIQTINKTATNTVTTSSSTPATVEGMTDQPLAGKYIALFNGAISTGGASASGEFGFYVDGVLMSETLRPISCNLQLLGGLVSISLNNIGVGTYSGTEIELNGTQTIDVRFRSTNGGVIGFGQRVMTLLRVK